MQRAFTDVPYNLPTDMSFFFGITQKETTKLRKTYMYVGINIGLPSVLFTLTCKYSYKVGYVPRNTVGGKRGRPIFSQSLASTTPSFYLAKNQY